MRGMKGGTRPYQLLRKYRGLKKKVTADPNDHNTLQLLIEARDHLVLRSVLDVRSMEDLAAVIDLRLHHNFTGAVNVMGGLTKKVAHSILLAAMDSRIPLLFSQKRYGTLIQTTPNLIIFGGQE